MEFCHYYQAHVDRSRTWFLVAALRSLEHISFDRTLDTQSSTFEFFVPETTQHYFLDAMAYFQREGIVHNLQKLPNRLAQQDSVL